MSSLIFSLVIPTCNRKDALLQCLATVAKQEFDPSAFEVIVVVDGSEDGTAESIRQFSVPFSLRIVEIPRSGPGAARNAGAGKARGTYLAFTEDDVELPPTWLTQAARHIEASACSVLEGSTVYSDSGESVRRFDAGRIPSFIPCNLFVLRSVFNDLGGYATDFFDSQRRLYFREDADLGFRILDSGCTVTLADDVVVKHPRQFITVGECMRHARRYELDPLLYKRHRVRFRQMIEVKRIFGVTIHRPQHYVALGGALGLLGSAMAVAAGAYMFGILGLIVALSSAMLFAFKYRGREVFTLRSIPDLFRLLPIPFVYLNALVKGCIRYRVAGVLW